MGELFDVGDDFVAHVFAHLAKVVVAFFVDGEGKGRDALAARFEERLLGVVDGVFLLGAVAPVAVVLGAAV